MYVFIFPRNGPRTEHVARRRACPSRSRSGPGTNWRWRCSRSGGRSLPHTWVTGDDEMGRPSGFREELRLRRALSAGGAVEHADPRSRGATAGIRRRWSSAEAPFVRVDRWCAALPEDAWTEIEVRDGEKGPLVIEAVKRRVQARTERKGDGPEELLFVSRERQADNTFKHDYYLSNATRECRWRNWPGCQGGASDRGMPQAGQGGGRAWPTIRCGTGSPGIITKPCRSWPRGS